MNAEQAEIRRLHAVCRDKDRRFDELAAVVVGLFLGTEKHLASILGDEALRVAREAVAKSEIKSGFWCEQCAEDNSQFGVGA
jgi:hypothetical protein